MTKSIYSIDHIKNHIDMFGFIKIPGFFADEVGEILQNFNEIMDRHLAENPHNGKERSLFWQCVDSNEYLTSLLQDTNVISIMNALLGEDFIYTGSSGNYYAGNTGWHSDDITLHKRIKILIYLENLDADNGALRVIPGTHYPTPENFQLLTMLSTSKKSFGAHGADIPAIPIDITPGDIIIFNQNLIHSSWGGGEVRKMISMNFHQHYTEERKDLLVNYVEEMARFMKDKTFGESVMTSNNADILRMTASIRALEDVFAKSLKNYIDKGMKPSRDLLPDMSENEDDNALMREYAREGAMGDEIREKIIAGGR